MLKLLRKAVPTMRIDIFNNEVIEIDKGIDRIKNQKETIKEIYHETINNVDHFDTTQIDKFFTNRYYSTGN